jgi:hypothetical protein
MDDKLFFDITPHPSNQPRKMVSSNSENILLVQFITVHTFVPTKNSGFGSWVGFTYRLHFVQRVIRPYLLTNQIDKALIILDQAKPHITEELKSSFAAVNCDIVFIPARLTGSKNYYIYVWKNSKF